MDQKDNPTNRYWHLHITMQDPRYPDKRYAMNRTWGVVAQTAEAAIAIARKSYPDATIWSVQHRGSVDLGVVEMNLGYHESDLNK